MENSEKQIKLPERFVHYWLWRWGKEGKSLPFCGFELYEISTHEDLYNEYLNKIPEEYRELITSS